MAIMESSRGPSRETFQFWSFRRTSYQNDSDVVGQWHGDRPNPFSTFWAVWKKTKLLVGIFPHFLDHSSPNSFPFCVYQRDSRAMGLLTLLRKLKKVRKKGLHCNQTNATMHLPFLLLFLVIWLFFSILPLFDWTFPITDGSRSQIVGTWIR